MKLILFILMLFSCNISFAQYSYTPVEYRFTLILPDSSFVFNKKNKSVVRLYDTDKVTLYARVEHFCAAIEKNVTSENKLTSEKLISALINRNENIIIMDEDFVELDKYTDFRLVVSQLLKKRQCIVYNKSTKKLARKVVEIKYVEWYGDSLRDGGAEGIRYETDGERFFTNIYSQWN